MPDDIPTAIAALKQAARQRGREAFLAGLPCVAPEMKREDIRGCWRLGWKMAEAEAGVVGAGDG